MKPTHVFKLLGLPLENTVWHQIPSKVAWIISPSTKVSWVCQVLGSFEIIIVSSVAKTIALPRLMNQNILSWYKVLHQINRLLKYFKYLIVADRVLSLFHFLFKLPDSNKILKMFIKNHWALIILILPEYLKIDIRVNILFVWINKRVHQLV
jgi:hypothetical protein